LLRAHSRNSRQIEPFHMFRYLDEQVFRYNTRATKKHFVRDGDRFRMAVSQITHKVPHSYSRAEENARFADGVRDDEMKRDYVRSWNKMPMAYPLSVGHEFHAFNDLALDLSEAFLCVSCGSVSPWSYKRFYKYRRLFEKSTRSLTPTHALKKTCASLPMTRVKRSGDTYSSGADPSLSHPSPRKTGAGRGPRSPPLGMAGSEGQGMDGREGMHPQAKHSRGAAVLHGGLK
jgi:hypothetical protein